MRRDISRAAGRLGRREGGGMPSSSGETGAGPDRPDRPGGRDARTTVDRGRVRRQLPAVLASFLWALALTFVAYPEVVLLGGSLSTAGLDATLDGNPAIDTVRLYPQLEEVGARSGLRDIGARVWQLEPTTKFVARAIDEGETPFWNPYSAAGSLGPETLVGITLSPFVVTVALFGASSTAFTFVLLAFMVLALTALQQFVIRTLGLPRVAALAASTVFLLGAWTTAMITSTTGAPFLLFPVVLYAICELQRVGGPLRLLAAVAAYTGLLLTTFLPGIVLVALLVHSVALVLDADRGAWDDRGRLWRTTRLLARQALVPMIALLASAWLLLPVVDAVRAASDELSYYAERPPVAKDWTEYLTVLTPRHVYTAFIPQTFPEKLEPSAWTVSLGLVPLVALAAAWPRSRGVQRHLLTLCGALVLVAAIPHLGVPGLSAIAEVPGLRPISWAYWASLMAAALTVGVGVAVGVARREGLDARVGVAVAGVFGVVLLAALVPAGERSGRILANYGLAALTLAAVVVVVGQLGRKGSGRARWSWALVGLMGLELLSYGNHTRPVRVDLDDPAPAYVAYLREHLEDGRIMNAGRGALYAEWGAALGIRQLETMLQLQIPWYREFFFTRINSGEKPGKFLETGTTTTAPFTARPDTLDLLDVRYIVVSTSLRTFDAQVAAQYPLVFDDVDARVHVYENVDALDRAFISPALAPTPEGPVWLPPEPGTVAVTDDEVLLARGTEAGVPEVGVPEQAPPSTSRARIVADHHDEVVVQVDTGNPAVLVLSDTYHPGWEVTVDGEAQHLGRVNDTMRGVVVPAGESEVVFRYRPPGHQIGTVISVGTVVALLVGCAIWAVARRRSLADEGPPAT